MARPVVKFEIDENGTGSFQPPSAAADGYNRVLNEWVTAGSLTEAVRRAGYSPRAARRSGVRLKSRFPGIVAEVQRRRKAVARNVELSQEVVVLELARLAFARIDDVLSWEDGRPVIADSEMISEDARAAIQEISTDASGAMKVKLHDKRAALVDLGKFMGLGGAGENLAALLARLAGASPEAVEEAQRLDSRQVARRIALLLRRGREAAAENARAAPTCAAQG